MTRLLQMTVQGAALIAVLLALRPLFRRRVSPVILYGLWLLPAARLLIPVSVASVFSLQNLLPAPTEQRVAAVLEQGAQLTPSQAAAAHAPADLAQTAIPHGAAPDLGTLLAVIWALGAAAVLLTALWNNVRFARRVRRGAVPVEVACPLPVYLSQGLSSPCLCGLFRPAIFLCDQALDSQAHLDMALAHELSHWRAGDRFWAVLRLICCAVHWFNPLVWMAARACVQDCEQACDHRVLKKAGQKEREAYGMLLLSYAGQTQRGLLLTSSPMGAGGRALRGRIALIARKPATRRMALAALALCVALTCLVACTGRLTEDTGCQQLIQLAGQTDTTADMTDVRYGESLGSFSGKTLANFLSTRTWEQAEPTDAQDLELEYKITLRGNSSEPLGTLCFRRDAITGNCYASVALGNEGAVTFAVSPWDAQTAVAMTRLDQEAYTLRSTLPGGGEMVLVRSDPAAGTEYHWLFYTEDGRDYSPISSDLDAQYSRVAELMVFASRDVGFVSFRYEGLNGYPDPNLYRTEDGGATWQRITLPMGDITTENGYSGIHVTAIMFEDEQNGSVTVSMYYDGGQADALSCVFVTGDGGRTWAAVTSGGPLQPD